MRAPGWREVVSAVSLAAVIAAPIGGAQARRAMTLVDLMEVPRVLDPQLSPDGRFVL